MATKLGECPRLKLTHDSGIKNPYQTIESIVRICGGHGNCPASKRGFQTNPDLPPPLFCEDQFPLG